jgi:hypothetical protein
LAGNVTTITFTIDGGFDISLTSHEDDAFQNTGDVSFVWNATGENIS